MSCLEELKIPFTWEDRKPVLLDRGFYIPHYYDGHENWGEVKWEEPSFFGNHHPICIEYCSGNGQWIVELAKQNPHKNYVAIEKRFDRARKILKKLKKEALSNLFVICGEALTFTKFYMPKNSIEQVYINFPDPWPKLRHAKHRLVREEFLMELEKILKEKATIYITTDDYPYLQQMIREISSRTSWKSQIAKPYLTDLPDHGDSYFLNLWKSKGRTIYHLFYEVGK